MTNITIPIQVYLPDDWIEQIVNRLRNDPESEWVEIVRCKDCKYQDKGENESEAQNLCGYRPWLYVPVTDDHYCGWAKRKEGEAE